MKAYWIGLLLALVMQHSIAQKLPIKFGDVPLEQLKMMKYDADTSASAVVLTDFGESTIEYRSGFVLVFERITRIKILKKDGLEWANFMIPLYHENGNEEDLSGLKAVTYNLENGKVIETKMKSDGVFKEKYDNNVDLIKVTLPNVKVGSVVEITYRINSDFLTNFQDWEFQKTIPVVWSEYRARIPEYFHYEKYAQGYIPLTINENHTTTASINFTSIERTGNQVMQTEYNNEKVDYQLHHQRWVATNVPAFNTEPFMTTHKDFISKINFELAYLKFPNEPIKNFMGSWEEINNRYIESEDFGGEIKGNGFLKKIVEEVTAGKPSVEEKVAAIFNYVKNNFSWNGVTKKFMSAPLKQVFEQKKGNSADINFLLASMLHKAGVDVSPVLISTRENGFVREMIAVSTQFNNMICVVKLGDRKVLLDATDKFLPLGLLPERCLNGSGLIISKAGPSWVNLSSSVKSKTIVNFELELNSDGVLQGIVDFTRDGYDAQSMREQYYAQGEEAYAKELLSGKAWELKKSTYENTNDVSLPVKEIHELTITEHISIGGDKMYINPFIVSQLTENPLKSETREYPVDFGSPLQKMYMCKIKIPPGYQIDEIPQSKILMLPENAAKYVYNMSQAGDLVSIVSSLQINKSLFVQDQYSMLREFYNQVVAKQAEQIVLKKK